MDAPLFYAIAASGSIVLLLFINSVTHLTKFLKPCRTLIRKYLLLPTLVGRHRFFGPWSFAQVSFQLIYLVANIFCASFRVSTAKEASVRAAHLSLINMMPAYFGFHLSFICDLLRVSLATYRLFHASTGTMSVLFGLLHVLIHAASKPSFKVGESWQMFGLIAIVCMASLLLLTPRLFPLPSYEVFLRCHQALAVVVAYAFWRHVPSQSKLPRIYLLTSSCTFAATFVLEGFTILYRNVTLGRGCSRALIARHNHAVRMTIFPARPWQIKAGQYVNVWIPSIDPLAFLQSHPLTIASWRDGQPASLEVLIEPQSGFTRRLLDCADNYQEDDKSRVELHDEFERRAFGFAKNYPSQPESSDFRIAFVSGPHGSTAPAGEYGRVVMIASGFGIAAQLPLLKELIQGFNRAEVRTRDIHLVWQLQNIGDEYPANSLLDRALKEDTLDHGYMLRVSIFFAYEHLDPDPQYLGKHQRVAYRSGEMDLPSLLRDQVGSGTDNRTGRTLITVSANENVRDEVRNLVRPRLQEGTELLELEYQPAEKRRRLWPSIWGPKASRSI